MNKATAEAANTLRCLRCDYEWLKRAVYPRNCPRCKSPAWDRPRQGESATVTNERSR
jgi:predicted Zn-ribbon and HTH transcriptional regulator